MLPNLPKTVVPKVPLSWSSHSTDYTLWHWQELPPLSAFILADGSAPAKQQTTVRLAYDEEFLFLRYDCDDTDIWAESTERDSAIFNEEVVELFIGPGEEDTTHYYEFEVSPNGVMLDLTLYSPNFQRKGLVADFAWDCPGLIWSAERNDLANHWHANMAVPWRSIGAHAGELPRNWRANFYRIERPRGQVAEFSCWSPTMSEPADYHLPRYFGHLLLAST